MLIGVASIGMSGKTAAFVVHVFGCLPGIAGMYIAVAAAAAAALGGLAAAVESKLAVDFGP